MIKKPAETIGKLIDKQGVAFIGSVDEEGYPVMKAMLPPRRREGIQVFYFTTNTSSQRVAQYRENPKSSLYFFDKRFYRGVLLKGQMEVLEDAASKELIWREGDTLYYPQGVTDPDYCVLRFTAHESCCYANFQFKDFVFLKILHSRILQTKNQAKSICHFANLRMQMLLLYRKN